VLLLFFRQRAGNPLREKENAMNFFLSFLQGITLNVCET
jgi:hypothetical protein